MTKRTFMALALLATAGCSDEEKSRKTLDNMGFTDISTNGYEPFACGDDYTCSTGFEATNPQGKRVKGVVCCGVFKGCSVKF